MDDLVETLAIGLVVSLVLIFISWWFWKRYDEPSEAQIEREESIAKKQQETRMWRAVEAQMAEEKAASEEQALYERRKAEERVRALPPPTGEVSNAFAAFDVEQQTPKSSFSEETPSAPSVEEAASLEHGLDDEVNDDDVRFAEELVEVRQDGGVVLEEHEAIPELPSADESSETQPEVEPSIPPAPDLDALIHSPVEEVSETEWSLEEEPPVETDWSDNWFKNLEEE